MKSYTCENCRGRRVVNGAPCGHCHGVGAMKVCSHCGRARPAHRRWFNRHQAGIDGLSPYCKHCQKAANSPTFARKITAAQHEAREALGRAGR